MTPGANCIKSRSIHPPAVYQLYLEKTVPFHSCNESRTWMRVCMCVCINASILSFILSFAFSHACYLYSSHIQYHNAWHIGKMSHSSTSCQFITWIQWKELPKYLMHTSTLPHQVCCGFNHTGECGYILVPISVILATGKSTNTHHTCRQSYIHIHMYVCTVYVHTNDISPTQLTLIQDTCADGKVVHVSLRQSPVFKYTSSHWGETSMTISASPVWEQA